MTTENGARELIYARFVTLWAATSAYTFDNEKFEPTLGAAWVRLAVRHGVAGQETLGPKPHRRYTRRGRIFLQIFIPRNQGIKEQDTIVRKFRELFEGESFSEVDCTNVIHREIGPDGVWWQSQAEAAFSYYETK